jgi:hypothetical protein
VPRYENGWEALFYTIGFRAKYFINRIKEVIPIEFKNMFKARI